MNRMLLVTLLALSLIPSSALGINPAPAASDPRADAHVENARALVRAEGFPARVAAAAAIAGHDVEDVALAPTDDPVEVLLAALGDARALQEKALARMTPEKWALVQAGAEAGQRLHPVTARDDGTKAVGYDASQLPAVQAGMGAADVDARLMWQATYVLAVAAERAAELLAASPRAPSADLVFKTQWGAVAVEGGLYCDDYYAGWYAIILDACGHDTYEAPAGGADASYGLSISVVVDTVGDDVVTGGWWVVPAQAGAINGGIAVTYDGSGYDRRWASGLVAGGGVSVGYGVLYDNGFESDFHSFGILPAKLGGGYFNGAGVHVDVGGYDSYSGDEFEMGSGWYGGFGLHADLGAEDDYYFDLSTFAEGSGGYSGFGLLVNEGGYDRYETLSPFEQGAGFEGGTGVLVDLGGSDVYSMPWCEGQGWGGNGLGILVDVDLLWDYYWSPCPPFPYGIRFNGNTGIAIDY